MLITICLFTGKLLFSLNGTPVFIFNYAPFTLSSSSMEPEYPVHSVVIIKKTPFNSLKTGDTIVYKSDALKGRLVFHRVSSITEDGIYCKGDKNSFEDNQLITAQTYLGKGVYKITFFVRYLESIKSPPGLIIFLILPVIIIIILCYLIKNLLKYSKKS